MGRPALKFELRPLLLPFFLSCARIILKIVPFKIIRLSKKAAVRELKYFSTLQLGT